MKNIKQIGLFSLGLIFSTFSFAQKIENQPKLSNGSEVENSSESKQDQSPELKSSGTLIDSKKKAKTTKKVDIDLPKLSESEIKKQEIE